ncbi:MAG: NAD(+)/NADH kinase [Oscillospiraceae bacterium]
MKFLIKANFTKENSPKVTSEVLTLLLKEKNSVKFCKEDTPFPSDFSNVETILAEEGIKWCDAIITVGGDGTLLSISKLASDYNKPILGINAGRLGFLTAIEGNQIELLDEFFAGDAFRLKKHYFLQVRVNNSNRKYCLNDVAISKNMFSNTVDLSIFSDGSQLTQFLGDGIIVATPTGSTAYSLSVGGPVVDIDLRAMIISPVAPHSLKTPSIVLDKNKELTIKINSDDEKASYASFDGANHTKLKKGDIITVRIGSKFVSIYTYGTMGQFEKVDKKLKSR